MYEHYNFFTPKSLPINLERTTLLIMILTNIFIYQICRQETILILHMTLTDKYWKQA
jgi:hypothetical protein